MLKLWLAERQTNMSDKKKILAVDDEEDILEILSFNLTAEGYDVDTAASAEEALRRNLRSYDLFILDVMMGPMSGFRLAEKMRKDLRLTTPVIFLTARDTENDRITGFNLGADDYLAKPFSVRELAARVKAILRRSSPAQVIQKTASGSYTIDIEGRRIFSDGIPLELTRKEYEILALFIQNAGKIFPRPEILSRVWGDDVIVTDRTVDVTIARIRKKLGEKGNMIKNKSGYGYYFGD
jgi:DNA-binding response OmpR family regulator